MYNLYVDYLKESVEERTMLRTELDNKSPNYGKQLPTVFKGDFLGIERASRFQPGVCAETGTQRERTSPETIHRVDGLGRNGNRT